MSEARSGFHESEFLVVLTEVDPATATNKSGSTRTARLTELGVTA
jgi:hypothetical protein